MSYENPKIVLIGAGSAQFGYGTLGDIFQSRELTKRKAHIALHDINKQALDKVAGKGREFIAERKLPFSISATTSRAEALKGADFCIISIEVGNRFELWEQDWRIPQQYGIRQVYGENGGPGGLFHSLRVIPPILEICADVGKICPSAYVFNFSNPMSRICTTVNRRFPDLKFIGLCHEIGSLKKHLPKILNVPFEKLKVRAGGLNHFSVLLEATYLESGKDAYPEILEKAPDYFRHLHLNGKIPTGKKREWHDRGLFKLILERFDLLPITTDSHFGEYIPWAYEVADHAGIHDFYTSYKRDVTTAEPQINMKLTERVVPIIEGLIGDSEFEEAAMNLPNTNLIPDLPAFMAVEVPAMVSRQGIHGIAIGDKLPHGFTGLLQNQVGIHQLTADAVLEASRDIVVQALLVDPVVDRVGQVDKMLDHMLDLQKDYLGYLK